MSDPSTSISTYKEVLAPKKLPDTPAKRLKFGNTVISMPAQVFEPMDETSIACSYLVKLFKEGKSEREIGNIASNLNTPNLSDVFVDEDNEGNKFLLFDSIHDDKGFFIRKIYDKNGKCSSFKCFEKDYNQYWYHKNGDGSITLSQVLKPGMEGDIISFKNEADFEAWKPVRELTLDEQNRVESHTAYRYDQNHKLKAIVTDAYDYEDKDNTREVILCNQQEQDSISYFGSHNGVIDHIKLTDAPQPKIYTYDENGNIEYIMTRIKNDPFLVDQNDVIHNDTETGNISVNVPKKQEERFNKRIIYEPKIEFDSTGTLLKYEDNKHLDGIISGVNTQQTGDCYLLAAINSIRSLHNGAEIIANLIKRDEDGGYTVTFPGVVEKAKTNNDLTGVYKFTPAEIYDIKNREDLSTGDNDIKLLEAAYEKYRKECPSKHQDPDSTLRGGTCEEVLEAIFPNYKVNITEDFYTTLPTNKYDQVRGFADCKNSPEVEATKNTTAALTLMKNKYSKVPHQRKIVEMLNKIYKSQQSGDKNFAIALGMKFEYTAKHALAIKEIKDDKTVVIMDSGIGEEYTMPIQYLVEHACVMNLIEAPETPVGAPDANTRMQNIYNELRSEIDNAPKAEFPEGYKP